MSLRSELLEKSHKELLQKRNNFETMFKIQLEDLEKIEKMTDEEFEKHFFGVISGTLTVLQSIAGRFETPPQNAKEI